MTNDYNLEAVYTFICKYWGLYGHGPSLGEIAKSCFMSKPNVYRYLDRLERDGRITRFPGHARSICLVTPCPPQNDRAK